MKTLVVIAHPDLQKSVVNKRWVEALKKYPERYLTHDLYQIYPNEEIDVEEEHRLLESVGKTILQFALFLVSSSIEKRSLQLGTSQTWLRL